MTSAEYEKFYILRARSVLAGDAKIWDHAMALAKD